MVAMLTSSVQGPASKTPNLQILSAVECLLAQSMTVAFAGFGFFASGNSMKVVVRARFPLVSSASGRRRCPSSFNQPTNLTSTNP